MSKPERFTLTAAINRPRPGAQKGTPMPQRRIEPHQDHPTPPPRVSTLPLGGGLTATPYTRPGPPAETLAQACAALVDKTAEKLLWRQFGTPGHRGITRQQLCADLWQTSEGRELVELSRCRWNAKPKAEALRLIAEDPVLAARHAEGLRVLKQGFPVAL